MGIRCGSFGLIALILPACVTLYQVNVRKSRTILEHGLIEISPVSLLSLRILQNGAGQASLSSTPMRGPYEVVLSLQLRFRRMHSRKLLMQSFLRRSPRKSHKVESQAYLTYRDQVRISTFTELLPSLGVSYEGWSWHRQAGSLKRRLDTLKRAGGRVFRVTNDADASNRFLESRLTYKCA